VQKRSHRATKLQLPSLRELDQRTNAAKQFAQISRDIENDLGGADRLSTVERRLLAKKYRLVDNKTQRGQFSSLERHVMSGNEIVRKPTTASVRDDVATAAAGALVAASDGTGYIRDWSRWV
jgi:hypothetical protein